MVDVVHVVRARNWASNISERDFDFKALLKLSSQATSHVTTSHVRPIQANSRQAKASQTMPSQLNSRHVTPGQVKSSQVKSTPPQTRTRTRCAKSPKHARRRMCDHRPCRRSNVARQTRSVGRSFGRSVTLGHNHPTHQSWQHGHLSPPNQRRRTKQNNSPTSQGRGEKKTKTRTAKLSNG